MSPPPPAAGLAPGGASPLGGRLVVLDEVGSTNDEIRRLAALGAPSGTAVLAGRQSAGRGRLGRSWHSPPGAGLYLSVLLRPRGPLERIGRHAIAAAVAVHDACAGFVPEGLVLKWPNDLLGEGRKLAGILAETWSAAGATELAIGIGVNVAHAPDDFPEALRGSATSLAMLRGGRAPGREEVAAAVLARLAEAVGALEADRFEEIVARFLRRAPGARGARVRLASGPTGTTDGLDPSGALRVLTSSGIVLVHAAESVRALGS